jgi:aldehyde:ferredoxin oxidoreductase
VVLGSGSFGWFFPTVLKYAGFDVVRGKSSKPVYVFIDDDEITFRDASHIWGKQTGETVKAIREELGERYDGEIRRGDGFCSSILGVVLVSVNVG